MARQQHIGLVGTDRLFVYIEKHRGGLPARVKAENLFKERWPELRKDTQQRVAS